MVQQEQLKQRQSNVELLRIICMIAIVIGHFIGQSHFNLEPTFFNFFISSGSRIATNIYILISCWFLQDAKANSRKLFYIWSTMFFYNVVCTCIVLISGQKISPMNLVSAFLPFSRKTPWFGSAYICILLLHPFLSKVFLLEHKELKKLCISLFVIVPWMCLFSKNQDTFLCHVCWFVTCYIWMGYIKRTHFILKPSIIISIILGMAVYAILVMLKRTPSEVLRKIAVSYLSDMKSFPNIICSICVFYFFMKMKLSYSFIINKISSLTFPVYCFHQAANFISFLWNTVFLSNITPPPDSIGRCIVIPMIVIALFLIVYILELFRAYIYNIMLTHCNRLSNLLDYCDNSYFYTLGYTK